MGQICDVAPVEVLKDAPTDMAHITAMLNAMGERFPILYGQRYTMIPALLLGSGGFVGTGPELFRERCRDFFKLDDMAPRERARLQKRYAAVNTALLHELGKAPAGIKAAMNLLGVPAGVPQGPRIAVDAGRDGGPAPRAHRDGHPGNGRAGRQERLTAVPALAWTRGPGSPARLPSSPARPWCSTQAGGERPPRRNPDAAPLDPGSAAAPPSLIPTPLARMVGSWPAQRTREVARES